MAAQLLAANPGSVDAQDSEGFTPLMAGSMKGHAQAVQLLLAAGAAVDAACKTGMTALYLAALRGHAPVVEELLAAGAGKEVIVTGRTALHVAAFLGHVEVVKQLLAAGADMEAVEIASGQTALHAAASAGHAPVVQLLLAAGADVDAATAMGLTPLQVAALEGDVAVAQQLLAARPSFATPAGHIPVMAAAVKGHATLVAMLLKALAARDTSAAAAAFQELAAQDTGRGAQFTTEVFKLWMADMAVCQVYLADMQAQQQDLQARRSALQHLAVGVAATQRQLQASAGGILEVAACLRQAATGKAPAAVGAGAAVADEASAAGRMAPQAARHIGYAEQGTAVPTTAAATCSTCTVSPTAESAAVCGASGQQPAVSIAHSHGAADLSTEKLQPAGQQLDRAGVDASVMYLKRACYCLCILNALVVVVACYLASRT